MPTEISYSLPGLFDSCIEMDLAHLYRLKLFKGKYDKKRWEIISFVNLSNLNLTIFKISKFKSNCFKLHKKQYINMTMRVITVHTIFKLR